MTLIEPPASAVSIDVALGVKAETLMRWCRANKSAKFARVVVKRAARPHFTVHGPDDPGNWFWETHPVHVSDPYARVNDDSHGKSMVWRSGWPGRGTRMGVPVSR